jgi:predicted nucleic acid-binding protein
MPERDHPDGAALPALEVTPVDAELHGAATAAFRETVGSSVSLVDRTSFAFMRRAGIERAIAVDIDFRTARFRTLP